MRIYEIAPGQRRPIKTWLNTEEKFNKFWEQAIVPNCAEILDLYKNTGKVFFRGEKGMPNIFRGSSRVNRPARDSVKEISRLVDDCWLNLGFEAVRNNSVFASSDRSIASEFGTVYVIFPIRGFKYTYINQSDVVFDNYKQIMPLDVYNTIDDKFHTWADTQTLPYFHNWSNYFIGKGYTLEQTIAELKELLPNDEYIQKLTVDQLIDCKYLAKKYQPRKDNLRVALSEYNETMIKGTYYAFAFETYNKELSRKLGFIIT